MHKEEILGVKAESSSKIEILEESNYIILHPEFMKDTFNKIHNLHFGPLESIYSFCDGYMIFEKKDDRFSTSEWGFIDINGNIYIYEIPNLQYISHGFFSYKIGKYLRFINSNKKMINSPENIVDCGYFNEGVIPVKIWFLDYRFVRLPYTISAWVDAGNYLCTKDCYYWVYIDENGNIVNDVKYGFASSFINGEALVFENGWWHFINTKFEYLRGFYGDKLEHEQRISKYFSNIKRENNISLHNDCSRCVFPIDNETEIPILFKPILNNMIERFSLPKIDKKFYGLMTDYIKIISQKGLFAVQLDTEEILPVQIYSGERIFDEYNGSIVTFKDTPLERVRKLKTEDEF